MGVTGRYCGTACAKCVPAAHLTIVERASTMAMSECQVGGR